jgi:hypothetical protein
LRPSMHRVLLIACATALVLAFTVSLQRPTPAAADVTPPPVPTAVQVEAGNKLFFVGHAVGTQNYVCLPAGDGVKFVLFTPQATLFSDGEQVTTHFFSPNPDQGNAIRATWQHSRDTSTVWAEVQDGHLSTDPAFVAPGAIAWLLLTVVGHKDGPTGGDRLTGTSFIQRLNTAGGVAPATGCSSPADVGRQAFVPYTADYFFYRKAD